MHKFQLQRTAFHSIYAEFRNKDRKRNDLHLELQRTAEVAHGKNSNDFI